MEEAVITLFKDKIRKSVYKDRSESGELSLSGKLSTRDREMNLPYYVVSYDGGNRTRFIARNVSREFLSDGFLALIFAVREIENYLKDAYIIDIEFGVTMSGEVHIYDLEYEVQNETDELLNKTLDRDFLDTKAFAKCNYLDTNHILSDMAYWGTAEVVGTNPRPLDYSLYRITLTDRGWSGGIATLGYQYVTENMTQRIGNKPYNSVNRTIAALTPSDLPEHIKYKLQNYYFSLLKSNRQIHENIENSILMTCYNFDTKDRLSRLRMYGFSEEEVKIISESLSRITVNCIKQYEDITEKDTEDLKNINELLDRISQKPLTAERNVMKLYRHVSEILNASRNYLIPQYSRQSRFASVARDLNLSLVRAGYLEEDNPYGLPGGEPTIEKQVGASIRAVTEGKMTWDYFVSRYGHLRKNNFDIRSKTYRDLGIEDLSVRALESPEKTYIPFGASVYEKAVEDFGLPVTAGEVCEFVKRAPKQKVELKYTFSRTLSALLDCFESIGSIMGIAKEDMSYLEVSDLLDYHSRDSYMQVIGERRNLYHAYSRLVLPEIIFNVGDLDIIELNATEVS